MMTFCLEETSFVLVGGIIVGEEVCEKEFVAVGDSEV